MEKLCMTKKLGKYWSYIYTPENEHDWREKHAFEEVSPISYKKLGDFSVVMLVSGGVYTPILTQISTILMFFHQQEGFAGFFMVFLSCFRLFGMHQNIRLGLFEMMETHGNPVKLKVAYRSIFSEGYGGGCWGESGLGCSHY